MAEHRLQGVAASDGVAVGPVFVHAPGKLEAERTTIPEDAVESELASFHEAVETVKKKLSETAEEMRAGGSESEAGIFEAHVEMADDPELHEGVEERVRSLESPESAVLAVGEEFAEMLASMDDEYMSARADDVRDVASQIAAELIGGGAAGLAALDVPSVILARSLAPSDTARIPKGLALGFVTAEGSKTSHVSIMARSMGIPAVVGVGEKIEEAFPASIVALDGSTGLAVADPEPDTEHDFKSRQELAEEERAALEEFKTLEGRTKDGRRIEVSANLGSAKEAADALDFGAEGVGLFRTEFLFMERDTLPTEDEQFEVYRQAVEAFGERPVIFRTLDVGGDKDLPGVDQPLEENPFLGWRGIRMCLDVPELFKPQLRALLRASAHGNLKVMFPMVADVSEIVAAKAVLEECREELRSEGAEFDEFEVGVMVETPAAAICASDLAPEVSFFSIGTNDLVQYTLAADRGNEKLEHLQSADHPAVLKLIGLTCEAAKEAGIWVGVCGEAAGEPDLIPRLVELGVTELSMSAPRIPRAKKVLSEVA
ncbi:phosphoenolpyruvate-protein phosphotransferase [Rubrobacter radiotolerans]|uniref:Phosphoenolpyruvate-protein phosphotransferase n=1 Tax=Rubrobacter radiotolerans TaxID=42256 RepID=A0A023X4F1_RUBRA|nr:phosphoenolpyruvate--protein phosphotransferase [Rubrobacter radiotolerans]AHY46934.1 phosphoenolpyruvate-protein phosphotransferase [Rubrobacter radiotolerans]MDX5894339.1 phosphoenolpyruvate--protein phosphotransferase [Rubrobacter radiotolerans]SMC05770.1 phosphoenolpyruvate--protein phosphotransferase [Rubrobacter radiotolerans DSM 5868]